MPGHSGSYFGNLGTDFMTGNDGHLHHRVQAAIGVQVASAKAYIMNLQQHLVGATLGFLHFYHLHH